MMVLDWANRLAPFRKSKADDDEKPVKSAMMVLDMANRESVPY
jgi:hypothetical protein